MRREVTTVDDLRAVVGHPNEAVANKVADRLSAIQQDCLSHSPLGFVAMTDADGRVDVSPKGDLPGFVHILDDADYFDGMAMQGKRPVLALEIDIEEVFFHCAKAFLRSDAWKPESWDPTAVPSVAQLAKAMKKNMSLEELEKYYDEANLRKILY